MVETTDYETERRDHIGALRQIAIVSKNKFFRRVGGDRLNVWYKEVCAQSFSDLEENVIRKACTRPEDADYFLKRVQDLKNEFVIVDLGRLKRGYLNCMDELHGRIHENYDFDVNQLLRLAQDNLNSYQYHDWKQLLNINMKLTTDSNGDLFHDE